ncbi:MAG TPA: sensor domain-containing protein, partial [Actinomycetes bacterium]|nr:sensor domain-containing protein [Actinomycetes bacterium]
LRSPHHPPAQPGVWAWLGTRFREPSTWMELAYGLLFALALAWVDLLVAVTAITVTAAAVSSVREAVVVTVAGVLLMPVVAYLLTAFAAARAALTRTVLAGGAGRSWTPRCSSSAVPEPGSSRRPTCSADGSSATCTTARSSA